MAHKDQNQPSFSATQPSSATVHDDDSLPTYSETNYAPSSSAEHAPTEDLFSEAGEQASDDIRTSELNPEARKKLDEDRRRTGASVGDYGFLDDVQERVNSLPSFAETELGERPQYAINGNGDVVSHDPRLNLNPGFLLRFLKQHASSPPTFTVSFRGTHVEWRERSTWHKNSDGSHREHKHRERVEVEDFSFSIDCSREVEQGLGSARGVGGGGMRGYLYAVGDWEAAHRGSAFKTRAKTEDELAKTTGTIRLPDEEEQVGEDAALDPSMQSQTAQWKKARPLQRRRLVRAQEDRQKRGLPGFVDPECFLDKMSGQGVRYCLLDSHYVDLTEVHAANPGRPSDLDSWPQAWQQSQTERDENEQHVQRIVAEYCHSQAFVKELHVTRSELYGWDLVQLESALRSFIGRSYGGSISIGFKVTPSTITIRPDNWISNVFELHVLAKILLWMCLVYPILLMYEALFGHKWRNIRCAFPLTRWRRVPQPPGQPSSSSTASSGMTAEQARAVVSELQNPSETRPRLAQLPWSGDGDWLYLCGTLEGEWLKSWEGAITNAVRTGVIHRTLTSEDRDSVAGQTRDQLSLLRGYDS
ncbi:hypothetical protein ACM66B_003450 [Microbotryomycetes sp. NB124-2]